MQQWNARATGSVRSPTLWNGILPPTSPTLSIGSVARRKLEKEDSDTTKCLWHSAGMSGCMESDCCSLDTGNLPEVPPPSPMSGKKTLEFLELSSKSERSPSSAIPRPIGTKSEPPLSPEICQPSPRMCSLSITIHCEELLLTMLGRWLASGLAMSTGARLALVNRAARGKKPHYLLTLRTLCQNGGVDIMEKAMSLSTNFGVFSLLRTSYVGLIATQSEWKEKERLIPCSQPPFGSRQT